MPGVALLALLLLIRPVKRVKLLVLSEERIGEFAGRTDLFLRRLALDPQLGKGVTYVGVIGGPCNEQLLKMFRRKLRIVRSSLLRDICLRSPLVGSSFVEHSLPWDDDHHYEYNNVAPILSFDDSDEARGRRLLAQMGVPPDAWFVCFHARDPAYLARLHPEADFHRHDFHDCSIQNFVDAMRYISSRGGYAIRMGAEVAEPLPDLGDPHIIDYAVRFRSDFGDIYLSAKCKFFVGSMSGFRLVPMLFHVPVAASNTAPFDRPPLRKGDLYIPMEAWSVVGERRLSFAEIFRSDLPWYGRSEQFEKAGVKIIENAPHQILDLTREMNERLKGSFIASNGDEELQRKYRSLLKPSHRSFRSPARMGATYLREREDLLDPDGEGAARVSPTE